jgi:hypothetical protein
LAFAENQAQIDKRPPYSVSWTVNMSKYARLKAAAVLGGLLLLLAAFPGLLSAQAPRQRTLLNADWRFYLGDVQGAEAVRFYDKGWQHIGLPHSFGMPYFGDSNFYVGYGWYRKHLPLKQLRPDQRVALEFEAAFQDAEIFVNDIRVGQHQGGYTGFSLDITKALHAGDNIIAVRLNNKWNAQLNPRAGEHNFNGGIYRNVYLVTTSDLHVDWYGTFVTTPDLNKAGGPVHIATDIRNASNRERKFVLVTDIVDSTGHKVTTVKSEQTIPAGTTQTFEQITPKVSEPALWSPQHPNMYTARTQVFEGTRKLDDYTTPFGFRWVRFTADQGFFLNGEHYYFHGTNVHQDHAGWGDGVTNTGIARDVRMVKQAGMDFIRGSHNPHSPVFSDECDRQGILLWSENSFWGTGGAKVEGAWTASGYPPNEQDQKPFEENVKRSLAEMIRVHRNHPSIIAWSMTNEVFFSNPKLLPKVRTFLVELVKEAHQLDPTRPAGAGGVQRGDLDKLSDIAGYNGDGATLFLNPGVPNVLTEYGSTEANRPGPYDPGWGDMKGQPEFPWRSGQALWCAFDHGSIFPDFGRMGMVDYFRLPKRQWYWYRNAYAGIAPPEDAKPGTPAALGLRTDVPGPIRADGTGDVQVIVSVLDAAGKRISNTPPVKLEIVAGPGEFPTGRAIAFAPDSDIAIRDGEAAIELRSYQSGQIRVRATSEGLTPAELTIQATGGPAFVAGVTRVAAERPYIRYGEPEKKQAQSIEIALNHPTSASSNADGHSSRAANDGDKGTYWQPASGAGESWWQLDFESHCHVKQVRLTMSKSAVYHYTIEYSDQGKWKPVVDRRDNTNVASEFTETILQDFTSRLLRIVFSPLPDGAPVQLNEVQILGTPIQ